MHIVQKGILDALRTAPSLRYSQLHPKDIESSHFKYHLDQLIQDKLVTRIARGEYALTLTGKSAVDRLSADRPTLRAVPKLITYTLLEDSDAYYLTRKSKEPYLGLLNMVGGKIHIGESTREASMREVYEKLGIEALSVTQRAVAEIRIRQGGVLLTHVVAYIYSADMPGDFIIGDMVRIAKNVIAEQKDLAPDALAIIEGIRVSEGTVSLDFNIDT